MCAEKPREETVMGEDHFAELLAEQARMLMNNLSGNPVDFTRLREISKYFDEIDSDGTDEELWLSATEYCNSFLDEL